MPAIRSAALRTEIMFAELDGTVVDRGEYIVVRTPSNPTFFWGNFIVFRDAPAPADLAPGGVRESQFAKEFPTARHRLFAWDDIHAASFDASPFEPLGFTRDDTVLRRIERAAELEPSSSTWNIRETRVEEWGAVFELCDRCMTPDTIFAAGYREFLRIQVERYARLVDAGHGRWFGVFVDGALVATCGVFTHAGLSRFQMVNVDAPWRRRGIAAALVSRVTQFALEKWPEPVHIGSWPDTEADRLYARLGFTQVEHTTSLLRRI